MFAEFLDRQPLSTLLAKELPGIFPTVQDRAEWAEVSRQYGAELEQVCAHYRELDYPLRTATGFLSFVWADGSRKADETPYFLRRRKLCAAVLDACVSPDRQLYAAVNGIWCICEETSWVISAHNVNAIPGAPNAADYPLPDPEKPYVDLFSAQTAMILALTYHLLKPKLDEITPMLCRRIAREIELRVLMPFMTTDDFWWMGVKRKDLNNWTPWILSNIMLSACMLPMERQRLTALLDRACRMLDRWLDVMPADGGCDEGAGYWNMAGGALLDCLQLLEEVTDGRMTFWQEPKIRNILRFPVQAEIGGGWFLNFADCDARPFLSGERLQYAGEKLSDPALRNLGVRTRGTLDGQLNDTPHFSRLLRMLFHPSCSLSPAEDRGDTWLPDLQVRVVRRGGLTLCCKGGHNGENHNHNDVGSFMLYAKDVPCIVDAGNMVYTAKTFSSERYTLWNVRGAYHSLPIIGAYEQHNGRTYTAKDVRCLEDGLSLRMEDAYPAEAGLTLLQRTLRLTENALTIHDVIALSAPQRITWVFMLRSKPEINGTKCQLGDICLELPERMYAAAEEIPITDPRMARSFPGSLWRLTVLSPEGKQWDVTFTARRDAHA